MNPQPGQGFILGSKIKIKAIPYPLPEAIAAARPGLDGSPCAAHGQEAPQQGAAQSGLQGKVMMNAPREIPTISDIVKKSLEQVADRDQATDLALKSIYSDKAVFSAFSDHLISAAVRDEINKECGRQRSAAWNTDMAKRAEELASIAKNDAEMAAKGFRMILMEYRLSKGLLGDYTADMLSEESAMYKRNARTLNTRAYWLDMIGAALPPKSKVRDALDERALLALQEKAGAQ